MVADIPVGALQLKIALLPPRLSPRRLFWDRVATATPSVLLEQGKADDCATPGPFGDGAGNKALVCARACEPTTEW